ncbi:MAG: hypothetical protein HYV36_07435 [Lentisphaerae bacterium]|nr:hypothetical protein [Lentisphaerota bacterium]
MLKLRTFFPSALYVSLALFASCDLRRIGPPLPELYCREYLEQHGFSANVIKAVIEYGEIDSAIVSRLLDVKDVDVRQIIGRNRHLSREQRNVLLKDQSASVREGVAMNPSLTQNEIHAIMQDSSPRVLISLAMNPAVPKDILIELRHSLNVSLSAFAQNPSCPTEILDEIAERGTAQDRQLLAITHRRRMEVMKLPARVDPDGGYYWGQAGAPWLWPGSTNWPRKNQ